MKRSRAAKPAPKSPTPPPSPKKQASPASKKVAPPKEATVVPYVPIAGGKASDALDFFVKAFDAKVTRRMEGSGKVMHAEIQLGKSKIYVADMFGPGEPKANLHIQVPNADKSFARAVEAGCKVAMPLGDQFWGDRYGKLTDPFGNSWSIATPLEELSNEEIAVRQKKWEAENPHLLAAAGGDAKPSPKKGMKRTGTMVEAAAEGEKILARNPPTPPKKASPKKAKTAAKKR